uniref:Peroxisomal membrane protein PEX16 n=1 Tax=Heterorhabditis bacteriophora TaxID=37862 RepID=A0A1I7WEF4_HETBA
MNEKRHSETSFLDIVSGYFDTDEESDEEEMQPSISLTPDQLLLKLWKLSVFYYGKEEKKSGLIRLLIEYGREYCQQLYTFTSNSYFYWTDSLRAWLVLRNLSLNDLIIASSFILLLIFLRNSISSLIPLYSYAYKGLYKIQNLFLIVQELVVNMVSNLRIRSEQSTPERCSSPPRRQHLNHTESSDDGKESCVKCVDNFYLNQLLRIINIISNIYHIYTISMLLAVCNHRSILHLLIATTVEEKFFYLTYIVFVTFLPEDDHFIGGSKRCNSSHGIESPHASKKRIYDRNMWLSQDVIKEELFTGDDKHKGPVIKGCIKKTKTSMKLLVHFLSLQYPTDENIDAMSVSERLLWRQRQELQSASKKSVKFVVLFSINFSDPSYYIYF